MEKLYFLHTEKPDPRIKARVGGQDLMWRNCLRKSFSPLRWVCTNIHSNSHKLNTNLCLPPTSYQFFCICCTVVLIWSTVVVVWCCSWGDKGHDAWLRWGGSSWGTGWGPGRQTCTGRWSAPSASSAASVLTAWWEPPLAEGEGRTRREIKGNAQSQTAYNVYMPASFNGKSADKIKDQCAGIFIQAIELCINS